MLFSYAKKLHWANAPAPRRYLLAAASVFVCLLVSLAIWPIAHYMPFFMFIPAVVFAFLYCGYGPSLFAVGLSSLVIYYCLLAPYFSWQVASKMELLRLGAYILTMTLMMYFHNRQRSRSRQSIALQENMLESTYDAIIVTDAERKIVYWNGGAGRLFGWTKDEAAGRDPIDLLHSTANISKEELYLQLDTQGFWQGRLQRLAKDGHEVVTESSINVHPKSGYCISINVDVTGRSHTEEQLLRVNRALRIISRTNRALVTANEETAFLRTVVEIIAANHYPLAWIGRPEENEARAVSTLVSAGPSKAYLDGVHISWKNDAHGRGPTGTALREVRPVVSQDLANNPLAAPWHERAATHGLASVMALPIVVHGKVFGALTVYDERRDAFQEREVAMLTELAADLGFGLESLRNRETLADEQKRSLQLESNLQQAQKMEAIGRLAGGIAHDFNNLLMVILAYSEMLREELLGTSLEKAERIHKSARRAADLTGQLLAFSRQQITQPVRTTLNNIVAGMSDMLPRLVGEDVEVKIIACPEPRPILVDRSQFEQVIMNLVVNARDAMPGGGHLTIEASNAVLDDSYVRKYPMVAPGRFAVLNVCDTGSGMTDAVKLHLFEPFFTTKAEGKGTGLGLSMVYGIVKKAGGFITVYSEPGMGTSFRIHIPVAESAAEACSAENPEAQAPACRQGTILVVEDDENLSEVITEFLASGGHRVLRAHDVDSAIELGTRQGSEIDLMLTDVVLRGGNGRQLAQRLEELGCRFPVVFMSGYTPDAIVHHGVLDANIRFLQKPFSRNALLEKIEEALPSPDGSSPKPAY
jgi:PAS domain S-box-containing protein